jgi:hypothetical protein
LLERQQRWQLQGKYLLTNQTKLKLLAALFVLAAMAHAILAVKLVVQNVVEPVRMIVARNALVAVLVVIGLVQQIVLLAAQQDALILVILVVIWVVQEHVTTHVPEPVTQPVPMPAKEPVQAVVKTSAQADVKAHVQDVRHAQAPVIQPAVADVQVVAMVLAMGHVSQIAAQTA